MKKLLGILVLGLLWCNVAEAKITFSKCSGLKPNYNYNSSWTIDLERGVIKEKTHGETAFWLITQDYGDTIVSTTPAQTESSSNQMMELLRLYYDVKIMLNVEDKTVAVSIEPNFKAPKHTRKAFKKLVAQGEMKKYVKGSCAVENLYAKKEPKQSPDDNKPDDNKIVAAASGSGFFVTRAGHLVTNHHVIEGCNAVKVNFKGKEIVAETIAIDKSNDLAIIKAKINPSKVFPVSNEDVSLLQDIIIAGYPLGKKVSAAIKIHKGSVTALAGYNDNYSNFQTDATINQGNSGGPIMNQKGNILGVAVATWAEEGVQGVHFGIKSSTLKTFAKANSVNFLQPNYRELSNADLGKLITEATVYLECFMTVAKIKKMIAQAENRKAFYSEYR